MVLSSRWGTFVHAVSKPAVRKVHAESKQAKQWMVLSCSEIQRKDSG